MEQVEGFLPCLESCNIQIEQHCQTLQILLHASSTQVYVEKRKKLGGRREVPRGSDCRVETYQSLKLRKDSV